MMPEAVLLAQVRRAKDVADEFGDAAREALKELLALPPGEEEAFVVLYDYWDYEVRVVWAVVSDARGTPVGNFGPDTTVGTQVSLKTRGKAKGASGRRGEPMVILPPTEHGLDFIPWALRMGGSNLEKDEEHKRRPLLYPVRQSGLWKSQNIARTLYFSEVFAHAAAPRMKEEGTNPAEAEVDYGDPTRKAKVPTGNVLTPLNPPAIDQALSEIDDRMTSSTNKSTVGQLSSLPSGTSFAAVNLYTQTELSKLKPYQQLAEDAIADVLEIMLLWTAFTGIPLEAYGTGKEDRGLEYVIEPEEIPTDAIYIDVELKPDVPTDRLQRINAAAIAVNSLNYPVESALEDIGVNDPQTAMRQRFYERMVEGMVNNQIRQQQMELEMGMQMQMQQVQQMQEMEAARAMQMQEAQAMMGPQGIPGAEGMGYNPAMGGIPPALLNPEATMEGQTGFARGGQGVVEV
jgi:hypothetical protein